MSSVAFAFALGAAVLHAAWNLVVARSDVPRVVTAGALVVAVVVFAPVAALAGEVHQQVWPYVGVSVVLEVIYYMLLSEAYNTGRLSAVYPVARGGAPVVVLLAALAGIGGGVTALQVAGVVVIAVGIYAVRRGEAAQGAIGIALATAVAIAAYTVVDREGLQHADPLPYLWLVLAPSAVVSVALTARDHGARPIANIVTKPPTIFAGLATFGAYGLVLAALTRAPAAPVAAVREVSIVLAVAAGAVILKEPVTRARWLGALAVTAGVCLVAAG